MPGGPEPGVAAADDDHVRVYARRRAAAHADASAASASQQPASWLSDHSPAPPGLPRRRRSTWRSARALGVPLDQLALHVARLAVRPPPGPAAVRAEHPGVGVVGERAVEHVEELGANLRVVKIGATSSTRL